jgi:Bacterial Ig-like domain (group 3)/MBG domain (YGX type)
MRPAFAALPVVLAGLLIPAAAHASTCTVSSTADSGSGTLRACITSAGSGDTIDITATGTITLASALPAIATNLTITGPGANQLTISGNNLYGVFTISSGTVNISGLTIANGYANGSVYTGGGVTYDGSGTLTVSDCTFLNNQASGISYIAGGIGGEFSGTVAVIGSTFLGNHGSSTYAAGAVLDVLGTLNVVNSTFFGNSGSGTYSSGSINEIVPGAAVNVTNSTFSGNSASGAGSVGGIHVIDPGANLNVANSILTGNIGGDCVNLSGGACASNGSNGNVVGVDAKLLPLGSYGGATQTMLPLSGSAAICAGNASDVSGGTTTDQRGFPLSASNCSNGGVDSGAVQTNYLIVTTTDDPGGSLCISGVCSLRAAITTADSAGMADIAAAGVTGIITLASALPALTGQVNIVGPGANQLTVSGGGSTAVGSVVTINSSAQVLLYGVTIANGNAGSGSGGGINNGGVLTVMAGAVTGNQSGSSGGGIYNANGGTLTLTGSTVSGNTVSGGVNDAGGGIVNGGTLMMTASTVSGNTVSGAFGSAVGGGIFNANGNTLTLSGSTVSGNTASASSSGPATGGGIYNASGSTLTLANSIVAGNSVTGLGSEADINGPYTDNGGNQASINVSSTSQIAIDLSPLQYNGIGATVETMIPLPGSPAICAGLVTNNPSGTATDERGYPNTNTTYTGYSSSSPCVDSGAVQTNYTSIAFVQQPTTTEAAVAITPSPTVEVLETDTNLSSNNTDAVNGVPITLTLAAGNGTLGGILTQTTTSGVATFGNLTVSAPGASDELTTNAITVVSNGTGATTLASQASSSFNVYGAATQFAVSASSPVAAGGSSSVIVTAEDGNGSPALYYTGTVIFTSSDTAAVPPANYTFVAGDNGQHTFNVTLKTAGVQTVTWTDASNPLIAGSAQVTVVAGLPVNLAASGGTPQSGYVNAAFATALTATVSDIYGNGISGETVNFTAPGSGATATLFAPSCVTAANGSCSVMATANGTTGTYNVTAAVSGISGSVSFALTNSPPPNLVVTSTGDDSGNASNCTVQLSKTTGTDASCSLRDALLEAASLGTANIYFDSTNFASATNIALTNGTLNFPSNTTIQGLTSGSGATLKNLVTVSGGGSSSDFSVFTVSYGVTGAVIANLTIGNGNSSSVGGGIYNSGTLSVTGCTFSGNSASEGGGIYSYGPLAVSNSTFSGNSGSSRGGGIATYTNTLTVTNSSFTGNSGGNSGGAIYSIGTLTLTGSTFSGNSAVFGGGGINATNGTVTDSTFYGNFGGAGGGIYNEGILTVTSSTISGNSANQAPGLGGGIFNQGTLTLSNSILSGNSTISSGGAGAGIFGNGGQTVNASYNVFYNNLNSLGSEDDCADTCTNTNAISGDPMLLALGNYGGPTQTMLPLPGSVAICAGLAADIPVGVTIDQRGQPNSTTYGSTACFDAGAVQTNYALNFSAQPSSVAVAAAMSPAPIATVTESGSPFSAGSTTVSLTDADSDLTTTPATASTSTTNGQAGFSNLQFTHIETSDTLTAALALTGSLNVTATSNSFSVSQGSQTISFSPATTSYVYSAGSFVVSATATSSLAVSFGSTTSGVCTVSGATVTIVSAGTCTIQATQSGNTDYFAAAAVSVNFTVTQASQNISFTPISPVMFGVSPISLTATGGASGSAVTFSIVSGPGSISGSTLTVNGVGTIVVAANQTGNSNYTAATQVTANIVVNQAGQAISFTPASPVTYGVSPISLSAAGGSSGNAIIFSMVSGPGTISGSTLTVTGAGTIVVAANQTGNANYAAATQVTVNIVVNQASQSITFTPPASPVTFGVSPISLSATGGSSGSAIVFSIVSGPGSIAGSTLTVTGAGTIVIAANQAGNSNYTAAIQATQNVVVNPAALTIAANNATKVYGTSNPSFTGSVTGAVDGNTFTESFATTASTSSDVGGYAIVPSATGVDLSDYTQSITDGTLTVTQAATTTTLNLSGGPVTPGQSVTLTAQVTSATTGTPSGTVSFYDGTSLLNTATLSAGAASYSTSTLAAGVTHTLSAAYSGSTDFTASASASTTPVTVAPLDFTLTISGPASQTVVPGSTITYQVTVTPDYGSYAGTVNFAVSGLPAGATVSFSPSSIAANGGPQTITVAIQTAPATAGEHAPSRPASGRNLAPFALAFLLLFGVGAIRKNSRVLRRMLSVAVLLAAGAAATMLGGCGSTNGFFTQAPQNYSITITATSSNLVHTATVTLNVQ